MQSLVLASPSTVVTERPSAKAASAMQELIILPSRRTVHAPQTPTPHPSLEPVRPEIVPEAVEERAVGGNLQLVNRAVDA